MCKTVLYIGSSPSDQAWIRIDKEFSKLQKASKGNEVKFITEFGAKLGDVADTILDISPSIIHFSGHGAKFGELIFEDENGKSKPVDVESLDRLFSLLVSANKQNINCVVLNACHSDYLALSISKYVNYVIGVHNSVQDEAAIEFSVGFYKGISNGMSPQKAFEYGCFKVKEKNLDASPYILTGMDIPHKLDKASENVTQHYISWLINDTVSSKDKKLILSELETKKPFRVDILGIDCFDNCHIQLTLQANKTKNIISNIPVSKDGLTIETEECIALFKKIVADSYLFAIAKLDEDENRIASRWNRAEREIVTYTMDYEPPYLMLTLAYRKDDN